MRTIPEPHGVAGAGLIDERAVAAKAANIAALRTLRAELRAKLESSCLMDGAALGASMTDLIHDLWRDVCAREALPR